jgi:hypothetical protein
LRFRHPHLWSTDKGGLMRECESFMDHVRPHEEKLSSIIEKAMEENPMDLGKWAALRMLVEYDDRNWFRYLYWNEPHLLYDYDRHEVDIDWYGLAGLADRSARGAGSGGSKTAVLAVAASLGMGRPIDLCEVLVINSPRPDAMEVIIRGIAAACGRELREPTVRLPMLAELDEQMDPEEAQW